MMSLNVKTFVLFLLMCGAFFFIQENVQGLELFRRTGSLNPVPGYTAENPKNDSSLVSRIIQAYQRSDNEMNCGNSMWQYIFKTNHMAIHNAFKYGTNDLATGILRYPSNSELFYGIDMLTLSFSLQYFQNPDAPPAIAAHCLDRLIRFAEAIGAVRLDNPEGYYLPPINYDADTIVNLIQQKLGLNLSFPNPYPYEFGILTSKGVISYHVPQALYQAWKIKQLVKDVKNPKILEIGAGLGRTAYYASLFGINDYTIIDLPLTALCSSYFLGRTLGEEHIVFHGENLEGSETKVKILTPDDFLNSSETYDLIINVDSMTEMDPAIARAYLEKIRTSTNKFLSINHEINPFTVAELVKECSSVIEVVRHPYWIRNGYVEELVRFK